MLLLMMGFPSSVFASPQFAATPLVIDGKGHPRDIMKFSVTVKNTEAHLISIYPWVTNFSSASGTLEMPDLGRADLSTSLANWIEVTRGAIDLLPDESRDIPVMIQINLNAKPGVYHAAIDFSTGSNRAEAEANVNATISVPVNIEVLDDANEKLQLSTFVPDKNWFTGASASFRYKLQNIGNRGLIPHGRIRIYDRKGEEVATIDANQNGERLEPSNDAVLAAVWKSGNNFGKYKAMLDLEYGDVGRGGLQDTVFFWVVPWQKLLGMFLSITVAAVIVAVLVHSRTQAKPAYARVRYQDDEDEEEKNDEIELQQQDVVRDTKKRRSLLGIFRKTKDSTVGDGDIVDEARRHGESSALDRTMKQQVHHVDQVSLGTQVRLSARPVQKPPQEHIINLKR
jgi:hypothetical protein